MTIEPQSAALAPNDRVRTIYPRYLADTQYDGPDGLKVISFRDGTPYQGEDLYFDPTAQPGFVTRCSRPAAHARDVPLRAAFRGCRRHGALPERVADRWRTLNEADREACSDGS